MLVVLAAMTVELEGPLGVDRSMDYWRDCNLCYTGIGKDNVNRTFADLDLSGRIEGVLSVGFGGAVDRDLSPGDLCLVESVVYDGGKGSFGPDPDWRHRVDEALGRKVKGCKLVTLEHPVSSPEEKRAMVGMEAEIVDQETYWIARAAEAKNLPFLGLRVVSDGIDQQLPPPNCYDGATGSLDKRDFLLWLARKPSRLTDVARLGLNSVRARNRLSEALDSVIPVLLR